jgi:hypothetical protein
VRHGPADDDESVDPVDVAPLDGALLAPPRARVEREEKERSLLGIGRGGEELLRLLAGSPGRWDRATRESPARDCSWEA